IYDCDGVIIDSLEANRRFYNGFRAALGRPPLSPEELLYAHTHTVFEALRFIFRDREDLIPRALEIYSGTDSSEESLKHLKLEPNLLPALEALKTRGILRAVSTSRSKMKPILSMFNLHPHFDLVVTSLDVRVPKPHPESVERILASFSLEKTDVLLVGDSEIDAQTALSAGVKFIAYKNRSLSADAHMEDHLEILKLV
ncbi:MAG TPA: HAD-IA family hydrolase, partial [Thermodesulfobacteriota bacterium]|nr:HAD-IA family hydrolase [Thermodesulfobacteriota bacterium]